MFHMTPKCRGTGLLGGSGIALENQVVLAITGLASLLADCWSSLAKFQSPPTPPKTLKKLNGESMTLNILKVLVGVRRESQ